MLKHFELVDYLKKRRLNAAKAVFRKMRFQPNYSVVFAYLTY